MTEKEDKERIKTLEETVKHLVLYTLDAEEYSAHESKMSMEELCKRTKEHKAVFQKFLHRIEHEIATQGKPEDA
ncbi:MAG: hypothetical protein V3V81_07950 [Candidatus Bathyarchaeia archaeon]